MKEPALQEWASRLLEDQLERLAELRNANPRDAAFKLWRQTTLTVIQRVWPGNLQRSEQFRRIPFTAPSARPNRAQVKEHYERGCAEASFYLKGLVSEIQDGALDPSKGNEPVPETFPAPQSGERAGIAEKLAGPLPGEVPAAPSALPGPAFPPAASSPPPPAAPPPRGVPPAPIAKEPRKPERRALKDMLGFGDPDAPAAEESLPALEEPQTPAKPAPAFEESQIPAKPAPAFEDPFRREDDLEPGMPSFRPPAHRPRAEGNDLLGGSPVFAARPSVTPAPASAPPREEPAAVQANPFAAALGALASEVSTLGVPEGQRAAARAALTDLARQIEERSATWETLRDAFHLVLEYPRLARRAIPLLLPFLDLE